MRTDSLPDAKRPQSYDTKFMQVELYCEVDQEGVEMQTALGYFFHCLVIRKEGTKLLAD